MNALGFLGQLVKREESTSRTPSLPPRQSASGLASPSDKPHQPQPTSHVSDDGVSTVGFILSHNKPISTILTIEPATATEHPSTDNASLESSSVTAPSTPLAATSAAPVTSAASSSSSLSSTPTAAGDAQSPSSSGAQLTTSQSSNNTGLIAGISVLAVLLAIAIGTIVFLVLRKRRRPALEEPTSIDQHVAPPQKYEYDVGRGESVSSLENSIALLENQLHAKDSELRETKAALMESGRRTSLFVLSDQQISIRFARLVDSIEEWVMMGFERFTPNESPSPEVMTLLQRVSTSYDPLLRDPTTAHLVLRAMVADVIAQAFVTDQFFGDVTFAELKKTMSANSSATDLNEWRALTIRLLSKTPSYYLDRSATVEDIATKIDRIIMSLTQHKRSKRRLAHIQRIVEDAAALALDVATQRALIKVERPVAGLGAFDPDKMMAVETEDNDLDYDAEDTGNARGKPVRLCVFPSVTRLGDERGVGYERAEVVCRAMVLV